MNFKFRPGDKVVCIDKEVKEAYGGVYTVVKEFASGVNNYVQTKEEGVFMSYWMEHDAIVNSPLMKALE